ncbi:DUF2158 domain-containing protein [Agrobacterium tumefaciens]|uniref:DUF2158 domain-containing protein n=1 Tax=Agrobacterium tumefaciens TaxID=358 RepID=UPI001571C374|nr:DUF2158 domain-containing protein [Agrobacterium tumefaciens]NSX90374.1 DUF2158 domain-containing protein [Agrobacterium tumefaciens]
MLTPDNIHVGQQVALKSGGQPMTVCAFSCFHNGGGAELGEVYCSWVSQGKNPHILDGHFHRFPAVCLVPFKEDN